VERATEVSEVIGGLLNDTPEQNGILVVSALHGLGGVGKTSLAAATAHHHLIRERFRDGVLWTTLGQQPDLLANLVAWIHALGDRDYSPSTTTAASGYLLTLLFPKNLLLVVDDVWEAEHAKPFLAGGPKCSVLITTRRAYVADDLGANLYALNVMTQADAVSMLRKRVELGRGTPLTQIDLEQATLLAQETGYLPLALELIGALIARGYGWGEVHQLLNLEQSRRGKHTPRRHHVQLKLEACLQVSLNYLRTEDEKAWECFAWLGVLPDETMLNASMAATLWDMSLDEAGRLLNFLADEAIIQRVDSRFSVHDLMHDMARQLLTSEAPEGLGISTQHAHNVLLGRYANRAPDGDWSRLSNDGYIHSRLVWHLEQSGKSEEIHQLLCRTNEDGQNSWYAARDHIGQSAGYLDDVKTACRVNARAEQSLIQRHVQYALITSSLHSLLEVISPQVLLILARRKIWTIEKVLYYIRQMSHARTRMGTLSDLFSALSDDSENPEGKTSPTSSADWEVLLRETRSIVRDTPDDPEWGAYILADLANHCDKKTGAELVREAVALISDHPDKLRRLSERVPEALRDLVLEAACNACTRIPNPAERVGSLATIIPELSSSARSQWGEQIQQWTEEMTQAEARPSYLQFIPDEVFDENFIGQQPEGTEVPGRAEEVSHANLESEPVEEAPLTHKDNSLALTFYDHGDRKTEVTSASTEAEEDLQSTAPGSHVLEGRPELSEDWLTQIISGAPNRVPGADIKSIDLEEKDLAPSDARRFASKVDPSHAAQEFKWALSRKTPQVNLAIELLPQLPAPRLEYVREILNAGSISNNRRGELLTQAAESLTLEERRQIALELIEKGNDSLGVKCVLATVEAEPKRTELFNSVLTNLSSLTEYYDRETTMAAIARVCPSDVVKNALAAYQRIDDANERASVILALTHNLDGEIPPEVFERLSDESTNGRQIVTLTRMVSQLSGAIKSGALDEFMKEASSLSSEWWIVEALTLAILRVDDKKFFKRILDAVKNLTLLDLRSRIIGRLMLRLARLGYVEEALAAVDAAPQRDRWCVLADLSVELAKDGLLAEAEEVAATIYNSEERSKAYATVALYHAARGNVEEARLIASGLISKEWRQWIGTHLDTLKGLETIPVLEETTHPQLSSAPIASGEVKFEAISEAVSGLLQHGIACNELQEILVRTKARNTEETITAIRRFWQAKVDGERTYLDVISQQPRSYLLKELQRMRPLLNISLTEEEARDIILAIHNVSSWWP
jgi:hypothetical protein